MKSFHTFSMAIFTPESIAWLRTSRKIFNAVSTYSELVKAARDPAYAKQMTALGVEAISSTPQEWGAFVESEVAKWGRAIRDSGARVE